MTGTPAAEIHVDPALVRSLIRDQFSQYLQLDLRPVGAVLLDTGLVDHRRHAAIGAKILQRVVADQ